MNKNSQPNTKQVHVGRSPNIEQMHGKAAVKELAIHEGNRALGEMFVAGVNDLIVDHIKEKVDKWGDKNVVKVLVQFAEFINEHRKEAQQGKEHKENMLLLVDRTLELYRQTRVEMGDDTTRDSKKVDRIIGILEYLEASYSGDANRLVTLRKKHPKIAQFVEKVILRGATDTAKIAKTVSLEYLDKIPFVSPESIMEFPRMAALQLVSALFNQHPDVQRDERIPLTKGGITGAFQLQLERMRIAREEFSVWGSIKDFWKAYFKFIKTHKFE